MPGLIFPSFHEKKLENLLSLRPLLEPTANPCVDPSFIHHPTLYPAQHALSGNCLPEGVFEYAWGSFQTGRFGHRGDVGYSIQNRLNAHF